MALRAGLQFRGAAAARAPSLTVDLAPLRHRVSGGADPGTRAFIGHALLKEAAVKRLLTLGGLAVLFIGLIPAQPALAATYTRTVWYGPYTIPAGSPTAPGTIDNSLRFGVQRPCADCHITSFKPDLVYPDGTRATMDTGPMLHHAVFTSQFRRDATCGGSWLGLAGERFFASGDERTAAVFPGGNGPRGNGDNKAQGSGGVGRGVHQNGLPGHQWAPRRE